MATRDPNQTDANRERGDVARREPRPADNAPRTDVVRDDAAAADVPGQRTPVTQQPMRSIAGRTIETARGTPTSTVQTQAYTGDTVAPAAPTGDAAASRTGPMTTANTANTANTAPAPTTPAPATAPAAPAGSTVTNVGTTGTR